MNSLSIFGRIKNLVIGQPRDLNDHKLFHKISLVALFAWVGLGADGLSSSCYGPEETFKILGASPHLSLFVALAAVVTIAAICASYSQIIELFPTGGGGYLVASKLLSPAAGVVSGSALLVDYVLTVTISVASGGDALFSLLPSAWLPWKLPVALAGVALLTLINLRGVRESVMLWVPVFFVFIATHAFVILYTLFTHGSSIGDIAATTAREIHTVQSQVGWFGLLALLLKAYSMGAGTYTGIEAVSNGLPILREPRVQTGKRTMLYMGVSLAVTVAGLLLAYLLFAVKPVEGKTLNAVLLETMTLHWPGQTGFVFVLVTLAAEAALLFIAAQAGFLDGPRVLANMALDRWFPTRFANLSDRLVTQNGVLLIGVAAFAMMAFTRGSVNLLVVLYSINVFITFSLSQLGMVRHWWRQRAHEPAWKRKLIVNGIGLLLTGFILVSLCLVKFHEGGWMTLVVTGLLVAAAFAIKRHYLDVRRQLQRLDTIVDTCPAAPTPGGHDTITEPEARTAVLLVNGYNGLGLHTLLQAIRLFGGTFKNLVFVQIGVVDAGNFKGAAEVEHLRRHVAGESARYLGFAQSHGYATAACTAIGPDVVDEVEQLLPSIRARFPNAVFFGGQLLFERETLASRWLHNHTIETLQRRLTLAGVPFVNLPIRVSTSPALPMPASAC